MRTKTLPMLLAAVLGLFTTTALRASESSSGLSQPAKAVYEQYLKIHAALAKDSMKGVQEHAAAIAKAARENGTSTFPPEVAKQADALAKAANLSQARKALKPLSDSLAKYLSAHKQTTYRVAYCPMAKASWIQTGTDIQNPYFGKEMPDCGEFKN